jgi:DNA-binding CsgD family transcriptional regulator
MPSFIVHAKGFVRETTAELLRDCGVPVFEVDDHDAAVVQLEQDRAAVLVCSAVPPVEAWARRRRVVLLDGVADDDVLRLLEGGAHVARPTGPTVDALLHAALSTEPTDEDAPVVHLPSDRSAERPMLTRRQLEVVRLIARGHTSQEIATTLGVRPKTVENYKQRVFLRLGVQNQAHAVARCARLGLMDDTHPLGPLASAS